MKFLASTVVHSGAVKKAVLGHFRSPSQLECLLVRDSSLQLCTTDLKRFEKIQPVFASIVDLQTFPWRDSINDEFEKVRLLFKHCTFKPERRQRAQWVPVQEDVGKDLVVLLSEQGNCVALRYCNHLQRYDVWYQKLHCSRLSCLQAHYFCCQVSARALLLSHQQHCLWP